MVFDLKISEEQHIAQLYEDLLEELSDWYGFNWNRNTPKLYLINDKKTFYASKGRECPEYVRGFGDYCNNIYVYSPEAMVKNTIHKYDEKGYRMFLKHELDHRFFHVFTKGVRKPKWLVEGNAGYVAEQYKFADKVGYFEKFLEMVEEMESDAYTESSFAVKLLVEKVGKDKYLSFLKDLAKKDFKKEFKDSFGFELEYDSFNNLLNR